MSLLPTPEQVACSIDLGPLEDGFDPEVADWAPEAVAKFRAAIAKAIAADRERQRQPAVPTERLRQHLQLIIARLDLALELAADWDTSGLNNISQVSFEAIKEDMRKAHEAADDLKKACERAEGQHEVARQRGVKAAVAHRCSAARWFAVSVNEAVLRCIECGEALAKAAAAPTYEIVDLTRNPKL